MKQNLPVNAKLQSNFQKPVEKVPLNELAKKKTNEVNSMKEIQATNVFARNIYNLFFSCLFFKNSWLFLVLNQDL